MDLTASKCSTSFCQENTVMSFFKSLTLHYSALVFVHYYFHFFDISGNSNMLPFITCSCVVPFLNLIQPSDVEK